VGNGTRQDKVPNFPTSILYIKPDEKLANLIQNDGKIVAHDLERKGRGTGTRCTRDAPEIL
jgi:hypothetical protein